MSKAADGHVQANQHRTAETATIEDKFRAMLKTTAELRNQSLNYTPAEENHGMETKPADINITADIEQTVDESQLQVTKTGVSETQNLLNNAVTSDQPDVLYASNLSLMTDEAAEILSKDGTTLEELLAVNGKDSGIGKVPEGMNFNYALAGLANSASAIVNGETVMTAEEGDIALKLEELSRIISHNIKNGIGMNGEAGKINTGNFEISMKLTPKELGDLLVKVSYSKGNVAINVMVSNKAAEAGVLNRIGELKESLSLRGVNLTDVEVNSGTLDYGGQSNYSNENAHAQQNSNNSSNNPNNASGGINATNSAQSNSFEAISKEAARHEIVMNYLRSQRLLYKTI